MNGVSVCLGRKTENAPTWRPPKPLFGTPFLAYFPAIFCPATPNNPPLYTAFQSSPDVKIIKCKPSYDTTFTIYTAPFNSIIIQLTHEHPELHCSLYVITQTYTG